MPISMSNHLDLTYQINPLLANIEYFISVLNLTKIGMLKFYIDYLNVKRPWIMLTKISQHFALYGRFSSP